ncbi:MAG: hypothetical protein E7674_06975 [Ruminococcaceae bacterium]|nr:hypothetical protein [Oscillospiraceae bacterium]
MNKKVWSIILLCVICIAFVCEVGLVVGSNALLNVYEKRGEDIAMMAILPIMYFGTIIIGGFIASVGFFCSLMNIKISPNRAIKIISIVSVCVWSVIFLLLGPLFYIFI